MITNNLFPQLHSAYHSHHSPEIALFRGNEWFTHECGQGQCIALTTAGFKCRLRHRWPWDFTTIASNNTRCPWYCSFLVQIVLGREILKNLHKGYTVAAVWLKEGVSLKVLVSKRFCLLFIHRICSLNASARLSYCARKSCPITPLLRKPHWLPVCYCFEYKILPWTTKFLHGEGVAARMRGYSDGKREETNR